MKKIFYTFFIIIIACFLSACQSNKYEEYYQSIATADYIKHSGDIAMFELVDTQLMEELLSSPNYIIIGQSSFHSLWVPRRFAIDCGKKHGALFIVVSYQKGETQQKTAIINVPTSQTTYHNGYVHNSYGGSSYFHGSSTTYGSTPVAINYTDTYYAQQAYFFAERKNKNPFGVYFQLPENIPGNTDMRIKIATVIKNSPADKLGIKKGDIVKTINGKLISSTEDIKPFIHEEEQIKNIEVVHE